MATATEILQKEFELVRRNIHAILMSIAICGLVACSGGGSNGGGNSLVPNPDPDPNPTPSTVTVSGVITYDAVPFGAPNGGLNYNNISQKPVRSVRVELLDSNGAVSQQSVTDGNGAYSFAGIAANTEVQIRVPAKLIPATGSNYDITVVDNTNNGATYALAGSMFNTGTSDVTRNLNAGIGNLIDDEEPRPSGPFVILDAMFSSIETTLAVDSDLTFPPLTVRWSVRNRPDSVGGEANGGVGTSFFTTDGNGNYFITLLGREGTDTDEYDSHIVVHEFGHYMQQAVSKDDSLGGQHGTQDGLDMRLAFSEGFATALSAISLDSDIYRDSLGARQGNAFGLNLEDNTFSPKGWFNEGTVGAIIFDIFDGVDQAGDDGDNIEVGFGPIYRALRSDTFRTSPHFTTVFSFAQALAEQPEVETSDLLALYTQRSVNSVTSDGAGETNSAGTANILPVFKQLTLGGPATEMCSTNAWGRGNKLGVYSFGQFTSSSSQTLDFSATLTSGVQNAVPYLEIYRDGVLIAQLLANDNSGSLARSLNVQQGVHTLSLSSEINTDAGQNGGDVCYNVSIQGTN